MDEAKIKGPAYTIINRVLKHPQVSFKYSITPWARTYQNGLNKENYLLGILDRVPQREELFHWIGPVTAGIDTFLYKLKSTPMGVKNIDELANYIVGVERGTYHHEYLEKHDFTESNIYPAVNGEQMFNMLLRKRVPLILTTQSFLGMIKNRI